MHRIHSLYPIFLMVALLSLNDTTLAAPLGTSFTYDGSLADGGAPANGSYDVQFTLYDAASGGSVVGSPLTQAAVAVSDGLFSTTLDFGPGAFTGQARWLEIAVRTNGVSAFTTLTPRQPVQATPYALHALTAGSVQATNLLGTVTSAQLSGTYSNTVAFNNNANIFIGNGSSLTWLNASALGYGTVPGERLAGTYGNALTLNNSANQFSGDGSGLLNLNASALASGTVPGARIAGSYGNAVAFNNSGNQFSGTFTGNLTGNATSAGTALTAGSVANFTGTLNGNVTGPQAATVVASVGGQTAANVASGVSAANAATSAATAGTIVKRDASGNFSAGIITANGEISLGGGVSIVRDGTGILLNGVTTELSNVLHVAKTTGLACGINNDGILLNGGDVTCFSNVTVVGMITARKFIGDGSGLTNVGANVSAIPRMQVFTNSAAFVVPPGVTRIMVEVWGAGGGGGDNSTWSNQGAGGGGGGYGKQVLDVTPGTDYPVIVGLGGESETDGGNSSFGNLISATGGHGGHSEGPNYFEVPGEGGVSQAAFNINGEDGGEVPFLSSNSSYELLSGAGGAAGCGGLRVRGCKVNEVPRIGSEPGGGGSGGPCVGNELFPGARGGNGRVVVNY